MALEIERREPLAAPISFSPTVVQKERLEEVSKTTGRKQAELLRIALDRFLEEVLSK